MVKTSIGKGLIMKCRHCKKEIDPLSIQVEQFGNVILTGYCNDGHSMVLTPITIVHSSHLNAALIVAALPFVKG